MILNFSIQLKPEFIHPTDSRTPTICRSIMLYSRLGNRETQQGSCNVQIFKWSLRHPDFSGLFKLIFFTPPTRPESFYFVLAFQ